ncbi:MAG: hypothetical protein A2676_01560 [Candidatus Sungbacteria bacterium RIFCSPHIGHO2_01_FULL_51_22]|uniref:Lipocalin-like domain-containing protein n=1 Tax=Candidatus Sungbacteria bacterium RIFCSPHIGHO2_02_FULL_51_29 TaxID=1802273 RepID=A0A1G2KPC9_9BACT|nr:MAG: hypothetical protein A2676_01560 [Candidatus Sungbacteria bacterium RIFCSPHIGHO2_01_FULL_51_22]OHA01245.1 MAG: hypothetical protein A3C16_02850 [Candidatus Sungbacteria bacterium RIFCSPHIGHO2_02_FULL_51_29]OHA05858.1 MAG: hypothetical protein A3B29_01820 [Candidatus Sungbacteria bacterium RIFCSPLOWO2_01_FULL_51_34]
MRRVGAVVLVLSLLFAASAALVSANATACPPLDASKAEWVLTYWGEKYDGSLIIKRFSFEPDLLKRVTVAHKAPCFVDTRSFGLGKEEQPLMRFESDGRGGGVATLYTERGARVTGANIGVVSEYTNARRDMVMTLKDKNGVVIAERRVAIPKERGLEIYVDPKQ